MRFLALNSPSVRRMCVIPRSNAILEKLAGLKSLCIAHVKSSAIVKVGNTATLFKCV